MSAKIIKYNPSFLSDQELIDAFVVRHTTLELVLEVVRDNVHETNQHLLVLGPRGSGKTSLLRRVDVAIRQTPELDAQWYPLPFGEESYEVTSAGEFWLEAIHYMGVHTGDATWQKAYAELLQEPDEKRLGQRCLARLLDFADSRNKRLLLLVENLNLLLGEQLTDNDAWSLRETLMHESRLMLLGSATSRFDAITDQNKAMFELFRLIELSRLSVEECQKVWVRVAEQEITKEQARAVQILTGGNPRLLTILAVFGANRSFRSLLEDLSLLVDEHTDYFKSNFENLPPAERKVFACLATLWEDSLAGDVAKTARMNTSKVSALLKRLESRGAVTATPVKGGKKRYQLSERLYNIYYLMRRGQQEGRVKAVVKFMLQYYGKERLHEAAALIAREACSLDVGQRKEHYQAIRILWRTPEAQAKLEKLRRELPQEFLQLSDIPEDLKKIAKCEGIQHSQELESLRVEATEAIQNKRWGDAMDILCGAIELAPKRAWVWEWLELTFAAEPEQAKEGANNLSKILKIDPKYTRAWDDLGLFLARKLDHPNEGAECLQKALEIDPKYTRAWCNLGLVLADKLNRPEEGAECLRKALAIDPKYTLALATIGIVLAYKLDRPVEGAEYLRKALEIDPKYTLAWIGRGLVFAEKLDQPEESAKSLRKALEIDPKNTFTWANLCKVLVDQLDQPFEGAECLRKTLELDSYNTWAWTILGCILIIDLDKREEGLECLAKAAALDSDVEDTSYLANKIKSGQVSNTVIDTILTGIGRPAMWLNAIACYLMIGENFDNMDAIESLAREAVEKDEAEPRYHGTLARALAIRGEIPEALTHTNIVLQHPEIINQNIQEPTDILTNAAALGYGQEALDMLLASPSLQVLEPLAAGLKQYLGLDLHAPQEVKEIADDIVKRIEYWKEWHGKAAGNRR